MQANTEYYSRAQVHPRRHQETLGDSLPVARARASTALTVGETLHDLISVRGCPGAELGEPSHRIVLTIVGGSKKEAGLTVSHPGREAGKKRGRWAGVANEARGPDFPLHQLPKRQRAW